MGCSSSSSKISGEIPNDPKEVVVVYSEQASNANENDNDEYNFSSNASDSEWVEVLSFRTFFTIQKDPRVFEYQILKPIGRGAQAEVYLVRNSETNEYFAAKVYSKDYLHRSCLNEATRPINKVVREIGIMSELKHPNIIKLLEVLEDELTDSIIIIQEFADKGSLLPHTSKTDPIPEDISKPIFFQICQGVQYLHANNVVHRDIKPENVFTFQNGKVSVGDFSSSVKLPPDEYLEDTDGTPAFYSPEQVTGQPYKGKPVDVWACGVSLYMMLLGRLPFFDLAEAGYCVTQFFRIAQQIQNDPVVFDEDSNISDDAKDLILHCLDKNPETRYTIEDVLRDKWFSDLPDYNDVINNMYPIQPFKDKAPLFVEREQDLEEDQYDSPINE
jgi:serine/threonine protein kinase